MRRLGVISWLLLRAGRKTLHVRSVLGHRLDRPCRPFRGGVNGHPPPHAFGHPLELRQGVAGDQDDGLGDLIPELQNAFDARFVRQILVQYGQQNIHGTDHPFHAPEPELPGTLDRRPRHVHGIGQAAGGEYFPSRQIGEFLSFDEDLPSLQYEDIRHADPPGEDDERVDVELFDLPREIDGES
jgi:hypothetical protein